MNLAQFKRGMRRVGVLASLIGGSIAVRTVYRPLYRFLISPTWWEWYDYALPALGKLVAGFVLPWLTVRLLTWVVRGFYESKILR